MITLTEAAISKLKEIITEENNPNTKLRVFVQGGGCSGFSQGFALEEEQGEDDFVLLINEVPVLIDSISAQYLTGATIDFKDDLSGSNFSIDIPGSTGKCGCGSSFSM